MIGFLGGTGPEGRGLAYRFALAGHQVIIGSRDRDRAGEASRGISELGPAGPVLGAVNDEVARRADPVFVAMPYSGHRETLRSLNEALRGKVVVDVVAPVAVEKGLARAISVDEGSAALEAQSLLPDSSVVAAFQTISAHDLLARNRPIDSDVLVCADSPQAKEKVMRLAEEIEGVRALDCGGLENAVYVENLVPLLLNLNRRYKVRSAIRVSGITSASRPPINRVG